MHIAFPPSAKPAQGSSSWAEASVAEGSRVHGTGANDDLKNRRLAPGRVLINSVHVRFAPKATAYCVAAKCREMPGADMGKGSISPSRLTRAHQGPQNDSIPRCQGRCNSHDEIAAKTQISRPGSGT